MVFLKTHTTTIVRGAVVLLAGLLLWASGAYSQTTATPITGWAWSESVGWISLHCSTGGPTDTNPAADICADSDYGLTFETDGTVTGWAWSDGGGWVKFGGLSGFPTGGGTQAVDAQFDGNQLIGWARACAATANGDCTGSTHTESGGWDGWIYLGETDQGGGVVGTNDGLVTGYAWGGGVASPNEGQSLPAYLGDESSNNNHAAPFNMSLDGWALGRAGEDNGALTFDGSNDYLRIGPTTQLPQTGQMSVSLWVRPTTSSGTRTIWTRAFAGDNYNRVFLRINAGTYQLGIWHNSEFVASAAMPAGDVNNWVHLAIVRTSSAWVLYRNGVEIASVTTSFSQAPAPSYTL
jgi:hypothetical protein